MNDRCRRRMAGWGRVCRASLGVALVAGGAVCGQATAQTAEELPIVPIVLKVAVPPDRLPEVTNPPPAVSPASPKAPAPSPASTTTAAPPSSSNCPCSSACFDWAKVPPVRPHPRPGYFTIAPTGPGYYSFLDQIHGNCSEKPPAMPFGAFGYYQPSFFDTDFRYLDKPDNKQCDFWDPLKRIHLGDNWLLSLGGQSWFRSMNEVDSRLGTVNDNYGLLRTRWYGDLWYKDEFRLFAEFLYADSMWSNLNPPVTDINRSDFLNLFIELKLMDIDCQPVRLRVGRQEMLYGSQRLVSTRDWSNTRRTFQGVRAFRTDEHFDVDAFWVQPVIPNRNELDSVDNNQNFAGLWTTYKPRKGTALDLYYLFLDNTNPVAAGTNQVTQGYTVHTLGSRYAGDCNHVLWDFEGMLQLGDWANQNLVAGAATAGLGYHFEHAPMNPQFWVYYDWASGESTPRVGGTRSTFQQLFPFGHYYFGYLDLVGRQNIQDVSCQAAFFPTPWITSVIQYHRFWLAEAADALYNAAGAVTRNDPTGRSGRDVGQEIDFIMSFHLSAHSDFVIGWSKLFAGNFVANTGPDVSPELLYIQYGYRW